MQDEKLLKKLHKNPDAGMRLLMDQYAGLVYTVVKGRLSPAVFCAADIEVCVADTFSEFYCDLHKYDPTSGSIKSWLCVIAKHNALDYVRRYYREVDVVSLDDAQANAQYADDFSLEGDFEDRDLRLELMKSIRNLGAPDCEILVRKFYLSQSSKEIAEQLHLTVSNVDTRTHRAIKKLREKFGGSCL